LALSYLGAADIELGEVERAAGHSEQCVAVARAIGNRQHEGTALGNLGIAFAEPGQVERARGLLEQALRTGREIKDPRIEGFAAAQLERLRQSGPGGKTEDARRPLGNRSRVECDRRTERIEPRSYFQDASVDHTEARIMHVRRALEDGTKCSCATTA